MEHSPRRLNALASKTSASRYLELGVARGDTFREVKVAEKTGVDPAFAFDTSTTVNEFTRLIQTTSDDFFSSEPMFPTYDLAFIDGLHTFEQVVRDFSNVFARSHRKSIFLIDDTLPNDIYSSLPDEADTIRFRKLGGVENNSWHGDVFKAVMYLHDFWPCLDYRTIMGSGNPQTLVWRSHLAPRTPRFNSLEAISRLTFFDLLNNLDILKQSSEADAINSCIASVGRL